MIQAIIQGCKAGFFAGLIWGLLILAFVSPIIQTAEVYEMQADALVVSRSLGEAAAVSEHSSAHSHQHAPAEEGPSGWKRSVLTVLGTVLLGIAFGVLTSIALALKLKQRVAHSRFLGKSPWALGLGMGTLGFAIFQGIPALGLQPALPGVIGADFDYNARQSWWMLSVLCSLSAAALGFLGWKWAHSQRSRGISIVFYAAIFSLLVFPFVGPGVPLYSKESLAPIELQQRFTVLSLTVSLIFWIINGTTLTYFFRGRLGFDGVRDPHHRSR